MKLRMYWSYATRSLARGGQRSLLAIFCVAVGVLAIVALQLVGNMINAALTSNVREANGGDIALTSDIVPLQPDQLDYFNQLKSQGAITNYTLVSRHRVETALSGGTAYYSLRAIDPANFPIAGAPLFNTPGNATLSDLLSGDTVVITKDLADRLHATVGDAVKVTSDDGRVIDTTIGGIIENTGYFQSPQMLMASDAYQAIPSSSGLPVTYRAVYLNVPGNTDANASDVEKKLQAQFPVASITTTKEALQGNEQNVQNLRYFLQVVGLLALLIGGVGIINTMQVLLRRRQTEIAMLKTAGYRRRDLYALFGLEAGLIGLLGGAVGSAAGVGVGLLVKNLVERAFLIVLPAQIDPMTVAAGIVIGFFTALIFGLLPIVQASQIRPIAVLRELPEGNTGTSLFVSILLSVLLVALFFALALSILRNPIVTASVVGGAGLFLLLLSAFFTLIVFLISRFPVVESFRWWYALLVLVALALGAGVTYLAPGFGVLVLALAVLCLAVLFLPRTARSNVRMALRNVGRQKTRTVTTLVALYIGVFAIGLILVLGQNIKDQINALLSTGQTYNSFILAGNQADKDAVSQQVNQLPDVSRESIAAVAQDIPLAVNGVPIGDVLAGSSKNGNLNSTGRRGAVFFLSSSQGYDLAGGSFPSGITIEQGHHDTQIGRNLTPGDANTTNVLVPLAATLAPLNLKLGDHITVASQFAQANRGAGTQPGKQPAAKQQPVTLTIVGFYSSTSFSLAPLLVDNSVVNTLSAGQPFYVFLLNLNPRTADSQLQQVQAQVPSAQTFTLVDVVQIVNSLLNNLIVMLEAVASLAMLAGIIIIANAVALAMLERRRELGILKSTGYTSRSVLSGVLVENGVVGFIGALLAMLLVTLATTLLGKLVFDVNFGVPAFIVLAVVAATALVCMLVAAAVAFQATRVRPLEVLRYE
ncbi:MAG: ABC transporter permease [Ktedonobacterales bacterium]